MITESVCHLSFCKNYFLEGIVKTSGACFFLGIKERKEMYIYI